MNSTHMQAELALLRSVKDAGRRRAITELGKE